MRVPRLFVDAPLETGRRLPLDTIASRHLLQVLRLREGDALALFDGRGQEHAARLHVAGRHRAEATVGERLRSEPSPALRLHLALGISRGERMDFALQKAVELGVTSLQPLFTERTQVKLAGDKREKRLQHWRGVIRHACEQSGRTWLPELQPPRTLGDWLSEPPGEETRLLLDHRADRALPELPAPGDTLVLLVGPEGGLSAVEREAARQAGFTGVRLGPRILRTETAPLAALAAIQVLWGDYR